MLANCLLKPEGRILAGQALAKARLKSGGLEATGVGNGLEALDPIRAQDFAVAPMDVRMPVMDDHASTIAIRQLGRRPGATPIIGLTALAGEEERRASREGGMDACLAKTFRSQGASQHDPSLRSAA